MVITVRRADPDDAAELVRLRGVMIAGAFGGEVPSGEWQQVAQRQLRVRLTDSAGTLAAFVVDRPGPDGTSGHDGRLVACAVGTVETRLASPHSVTGETGYVMNVATDPEFRRRGYSRACMEELLDWFAKRGVARVNLSASADGEPLYRSLGFRPPRHPVLQLDLSAVPRDGV